ncbi:MAG TPA: hypothetical protein VFR09_00310 [Alphaproteobacteria bacterium]|nr:hypothetical protein [Alphaproteobacteria bacterium]
MANTKATTATKATYSPLALALGALGVILALFALTNLFSSYTPIADLNNRIDDELKVAVNLDPAQRIPLFNEMKELQENALRAKPSEPYGWARLSYLRETTDNDQKEAFAALQMSDFVSPWEAAQLPERAFNWRHFRGIETKQQQDYQDALWQKAATVSFDPTWDLAVHQRIVGEVKDALTRKDLNLAESWKGKMADTGTH